MRAHIEWTRLRDEQSVLDQLRAALPTSAEQPALAQVLAFLQDEDLQPGSVEHGRTVYAYTDGPREPGSPVECEWYIEFRFDHERGKLRKMAVERRLVGP